MTTESQVVFKQATLRYDYQGNLGFLGPLNKGQATVKVIYGVDKRTGNVTAYQNDINANLSTVKPSDLTALAIWSPTFGKKGRWISTTNKTIPTSAANDPTWDQLIANQYNSTDNETVLNTSIKESVNDDSLFTAEERNLVNFPGVNQTSVDPEAPTADPPQENPDDRPTPAASSEDEQETKPDRTLVRSGSFGTWRYPKELPMNVSDLIQFTIIDYTTRVQTGQENNNQVQTPDALKILSLSTRGSRAKADVKGTINLAIQPPVSDTNGVNWTDTGINLVQLGAAAGSLGFIQGGFGGASGVLNQIAQGEAADAKNIRDALKVFFAQKASQASNLLSRLTGSVLNPNLETLFEGPRTRSFNYQFQFTPRDESEATEVRSIIRTFKEAMAVKRTESLGFLKAPYVFNIRYLYKEGQDHPYIGRVKGPCALKDMQTDYTPEGSYMTYEGGKDGGSMVKYTITLVFQELDPVYADDYVALGNENIIGY
jgi:hypothetical protein